MRLAVLTLAAAMLAAQAAAQYLPDIRVVLADAEATYMVAGDLAWYVDDRGVGSTNEIVQVSLSGSDVVATINGNRCQGARIAAEARTGNLRCLNRQYHGRIEFYRGKSGSLVALNVLSLDDYIAGVVPSEMPHSWPEEALKAQAVAARTYAVARMAANSQASYDVYSTVADQAYKGASGEQLATTQAVRQTSGQVLTYNGGIITAYYSSDAGGYTLDGNLPYLRAVPSHAPESPHNGWSVNLSPAELLQIARGAGFSGNSVDSVTVANDAVSGHLLSLTFKGGGSQAEITGPQLRKTLGYSGLKSTRITVTGDGQFLAPAEPVASPPAAVDIVVKQTPVLQPVATDGSGTLPLFAFNRPWVASADGQFDLKLRLLYASNGRDLLQCNRELYAVAGERFSVPAEFPDPDPGFNLPPPRESAPVLTELRPGSKGLVLNGSGYGHGIGLSQWGARQLALEGKDYRAILQYFYYGVELVNWDGTLVDPGFVPDESGFYDPFEVQLN